MRQFVLVTYNRILRIPVIGFLVGGIVRGTKRLLGISPRTSVDRLEVLTTSMGAMRTRLEDMIEHSAGMSHLQERVAQLEKDLAMQRIFVAQVLELVESREVLRTRRTNGTGRSRSHMVQDDHVSHEPRRLKTALRDENAS